MGQPFIGSEALAAGAVTWHELEKYYRSIAPNVYLDKRVTLALRHRTEGAWLWSHRQGVVSGLAASALHGANWVDDDATVELIWRNARAPHGIKTRADLILDGESQHLAGVVATTPERTAFDLGRRGPLRQAVARLDALANATHFKIDDVARLASRHRHTRGLRQLEAALYLVDAGAQSPKETWLRLLLSDAGFPRPQTQIPVLGPDGYPKYFLDMGWEDVTLAVEYDGDQHRTSRSQFVKDVERLEYIRQAGWTHVTVLAEHRGYDVVRRVREAWDALKRR
ncbi:hypothetical protein [Mycolicibacter virginiensis]|uniref:DUF559 domain-containing protein n=1 Tax=Mycolicibacter virginiensis TaxID=1795032 RepID=A0A9X7NWR1_9MYCO|nr:hypothetical protein [Mycolicibacter virginiensis]PQM50200.1 hypothetical protein C5U48_21375 [Mycolicibacter virginiensis]ULP48630.1 hypothetical protein MJO54_05845 [Mycolicibacter virginiensis]